MKFCKDCKHAEVSSPLEGQDAFLRCSKTEPLKWGEGYDRDPVTGVKAYTICSYVRHDEEKCGLQAKWFEPQ